MDGQLCGVTGRNERTVMRLIQLEQRASIGMERSISQKEKIGVGVLLLNPIHKFH